MPAKKLWRKAAYLVKRFENDKAVFDVDKDCRNFACMSLLQIGELTGHLTGDFWEETKNKFSGR